MENKFLRISHVADIQVKDRNQSLFKATEHTLKSIEEYLVTNKVPIHIISGDLFEFATANDSERKLIYNHIARLVAIPTLLEIVIIAGNHDLVKDNKAVESQKNNNPISIFTDVIKYFDSDKIRYCAKSGVYNSRIIPELRYIAYSLEDGEEFWSTIKDGLFENSSGELRICLFHAMIREYVDYDKLPIRPDIYNKLKNLELFPNNSLIAAGDIHKTLIFEDKENKKRFVYPGSTMQHTYGEGTYVNVSNDVAIKEADKKYIMEYHVPVTDANNLSPTRYKTIEDIRISKSEIKDSICYTTINLDSKVPYDVIKDNLTNYLLTKALDKASLLRLGAVTNNIKIKSSNIFISKEQDIYNIIKNYFKAYSFPVNISFEYDKFIQATEFSSNKVLQSVIDEQSSKQSSEKVINSENLDNLLLSEEQLYKLFDSVLSPLIARVSNDFESEIKEDDVHSEILNLFKTELNKSAEISSARYNIKFESIETNGFMFLGANRIELNIPGIVRILGTNGIGKTTLYRMIRWCANGMAFENMSGKTVIKNNLLVFNNKLPDNNFVIVKMTLNINGQVVILTRTVERVWKQNITEEQKLQQNWSDYVADVKRNFKLELITKDGETKTYVGENAEKTVLRWFGSTIENILFLNQTKIETILKSDSNKLNELILQYIGVDYLQKLEANLDTVKSNLYEIAKPKRKREDIQEAMCDAKVYIGEVEKDLKERLLVISGHEANEISLNNEISACNDKLIDLGDIPKQIDKLTDDFNMNVIGLTELESNDLEEKEKKVFEKQKPVNDLETITKHGNTLKQIKADIETHQSNIGSLDICKNNLWTKIDDTMNTIIESSNNDLSAIIKLENSNDKQISETYIKVADYYKDINLQLKSKEEEKFRLKVNHQTKIKKSEERIAQIKEELSSGICPTCKRPFADDLATFEEHKQQLLTEELNLKASIDDEQAEIDKLDDWFDKASKVKTKQAELERLATQEKYNVFETENKTILQYKTIIDGLLVNREELTKEKNDKMLFIEQARQINLIKYSNYEIPKRIADLLEVRNLIVERQDIDTKVENENEKIEQSKASQLLVENKINKINQEYTEALEVYNTEVEENQKFNESVEEHNNLVRDIKRKIESLNDSNKTITAEIKLLEEKKPKYQELLDKRNTLTTERDNISETLKQSRSDINSLNIKKVSYENQLKDIQKEYDDYLKYVKNDYIWKLYQKLIKSSFKDIVFDYYRNYLNNTLNYLLSDVNFKLYWDKNSELTMISCENGVVTYQSVQQTSGMEITFLGLSLLYTIHVLNVKNSVSHIFLDELSGTLNKGKELSYSAANYQEKFTKILSKFVDKTIFIIDHSIDDLSETVCYEVIPQEKSSKYVRKD